MKKIFNMALAVLLVISALQMSSLTASAIKTDLNASAANAVKTRDEATSWLNGQDGASYDFGNFYDDEGNYWGGTQCTEFVRAYVNWLVNGDAFADAWGGPTGNGGDIWKNSLWSRLGWTIYENTAEFVPEPGDIFDSPWHTGVVISSTVTNAVIADANARNTTPYDGDPVWVHSITWRALGANNAYSPHHFIRPNFSSPIPTSNNPYGVVDGIKGGESEIRVTGWVFDADDYSSSIDVHVYIGGAAGDPNAEGHSINANIERPDVNAVYGCGNFHGFDSYISTSKRGTQNVYLYAINIGGGENVLIGSGTVTITEAKETPTDSEEDGEYYTYYLVVPADWFTTNDSIGLYYWVPRENAKWPGVEITHDNCVYEYQDGRRIYKVKVWQDDSDTKEDFITTPTILFNSYVDALVDPVNGHQINNINVEGYFKGDVIPYGSDTSVFPHYPENFETHNFNNMIFVPNPDNMVQSEFSHAEAIKDGVWYYYWGNGEYGITKNKITESSTDTTDNSSKPIVIIDDSDSIDNNRYIKELTADRWILSKVYDGNKETDMYRIYGSILYETGAYLEFYNDKTFNCCLGFVGCSGTYSIEKGILTVHITRKYLPTSAGSEICDEYQTLVWDIDDKNIRMTYNGVTNEFKKHSKQMGDVNSDSKVTMEDVVLLQKHIANLIVIAPEQKALTDVNRDGDITMVDVTTIQKYIAKLIEKF